MTEEDYANPATKEILGKLFAWSKRVVALLRLPFNKDKAGKSLTHYHLGQLNFRNKQHSFLTFLFYVSFLFDVQAGKLMSNGKGEYTPTSSRTIPPRQVPLSINTYLISHNNSCLPACLHFLPILYWNFSSIYHDCVSVKLNDRCRQGKRLGRPGDLGEARETTY